MFLRILTLVSTILLTAACASTAPQGPQLTGFALQTQLLAAQENAKTMPPAERIALYQRLMAQAPDSSAVKVGYADALRMAGRAPEALKLVKPLLAEKPVRMDTLVAYHKALIADNDFVGAEQSLLKYIPQVQGSYAKQQKNLYLAAVATARAALQPEPTKPDFDAGEHVATVPLYNLLGVARAAQSHHAKAIQAFELAAKYASPQELAVVQPNLELSRQALKAPEALPAKVK